MVTRGRLLCAANSRVCDDSRPPHAASECIRWLLQLKESADAGVTAPTMRMEIKPRGAKAIPIFGMVESTLVSRINRCASGAAPSTAWLARKPPLQPCHDSPIQLAGPGGTVPGRH